MPHPSIDYIFCNERRRNRLAFFLGLIIAFLVAGVALASLPPDDQGTEINIQQPAQ